MRGQSVLSMVALIGLLVVPQSQGGQPPCANLANCAQVGFGNAGGTAGAPGATVPMSFAFTQGPSGTGIGQIAAIAFSVVMPAGALTLADCNSNGDLSNPLPNAVQPNASLAGYRLVVENAYCSATRTHSLCPDATFCPGVAPDNFMNVVIYGPDPLPTPGPSPIAIPTLPSGSHLFTVNFKVSSGAGGVIPLHILNQVDDSVGTKPAYTALLSVGDVNAVDQTCDPSKPIPPCSDPSAASQVVVSGGSVMVTNGCTGSCDYSGQVTVDKILTMVNIALGNQLTSACWAGDANGDGLITIDEILAALTNALQGCPSA